MSARPPALDSSAASAAAALLLLATIAPSGRAAAAASAAASAREGGRGGGGLAYAESPGPRLGVLFVTLDARGHFASYPGLWDGLARRGHDVTVAFPAGGKAAAWFDEYRALYDNTGLPNLRLWDTGASMADHIDRHDDEETASGFAHHFDLMTSVVPSLSAVAAAQLPALESYVDERGVPDVVVHDLIAFSGVALCRKYGVPCVAAHPWLNIRSSFMNAWRPPLGMELDAFEPTFAERLGLAVGGQLAKFLSSYVVWRVVTNCDRVIGNDRFAGLKAWEDDWHWLRGPLGCPRHGVDLVPIPPGLDQAQVAGPATFFVGPMRDMERYPPLDPRSDVARFLDKAERDSAPVILVAMGVTAVVSDRHVEDRLAIIQDLTSDGTARVLWGNRGSLTNDTRLDESTTLVAPWVPQEAVLRHPATAIFFTHGGSTSMMEFLAAGIPCVCQPYAFEQVNNCLMLQRRGVCVYVPKKAPAGEISEAARMILRNYESYASNVQKVWGRVVAAGTGEDAFGARRAVEVVENVAWNGYDYLLPEVCRWPLYQQYHLDVALFLVLAAWLVQRALRLACFLVAKRRQQGQGQVKGRWHV